MRRTAATRIILWSAVALVLVIVLMLGISGRRLSFADIGNIGIHTAFSYDNPDEYKQGGASIPVDSINKIDINWVSGAVNVSVYDGNEIRFSEESSRTLEDYQVMHYRVKNQKLTIQFCESRSGFRLNNMPGKTLTLLLPASMNLASLAIENVSSGIRVDALDMYIDQVDIENVSGSTQLYGLNTGSLDIEAVSGSLHVEGSVDAIDAEAVSGSQSYSLTQVPSHVDIESVSGSIRINLPKDSGFTVRMESVSGSLSSNFAELVNRRTAVYGDGKRVFDIETISGSVTVDHDPALDAASPKPSKEAAPVPSEKPAKESVPSSKRSY